MFLMVLFVECKDSSVRVFQVGKVGVSWGEGARECCFVAGWVLPLSNV